MKPIHNRMPAILRQEDHARWLEPTAVAPEALTPLLQPYAADQMLAFPVTTLVNNPAIDRVDCIVPA